MVGYGTNIILRQCSLHVHQKEIMVLMGPSGTGKSTLLYTLLGIITPISGSILLHGVDLSSKPMEMRNIGYLPQEYGLFPHMTVEENISFGLRVRNIPKQKQVDTTTAMLQLVHLEGYEKRNIQELSGGEKQRVGLARALAIQPELLLLDEPLSSIDQVTKMDVAKDLRELFHNLSIPIILVTHNIEDVALLAERVAIMRNGTIEQVGTLREVRSQPKNQYIQRLMNPFF